MGEENLFVETWEVVEEATTNKCLGKGGRC